MAADEPAVLEITKDQTSVLHVATAVFASSLIAGAKHVEIQGQRPECRYYATTGGLPRVLIRQNLKFHFKNKGIVL